ncbi:nitroreductase family protein [Streptomyces sp. 21So2-11]|uniref:Acg family FMN-binding oxidoreductase n=1 Tax=Streptomyces sp. 21So2-11 TaxID=3144408 RepID=UPI00321B4831
MPATALDASTLETLISAATAAPSMHNTQPWRYRLDPDSVTLEVRAVPERGLRHADPTGRALHISVGTSLFNLRVAVAHFGWEPAVRLLPRPDEPDLLATVRMSAAVRSGTSHRADLHEAIWRRHSSRFPFSDRRPPPAVRTELVEAAHVEGSALSFPARSETERLLRLTFDAERRNTADPDRSAESRRWVRDVEGAMGALPSLAPGPQDSRGRLPMREFTARRHREQPPPRDFERSPAIAVLTTEHDGRTDWLRAGQALEHVLLAATAHGLQASLLHQAMEWPDLRRSLRTPVLHGTHVQMLIRFGYGPQGPTTSRRPPSQVLDIPAGSARD